MMQIYDLHTMEPYYDEPISLGIYKINSICVTHDHMIVAYSTGLVNLYSIKNMKIVYLAQLQNHF